MTSLHPIVVLTLSFAGLIACGGKRGAQNITQMDSGNPDFPKSSENKLNLTTAELETEIRRILGDSSSWKTKPFESIRGRSTCAEVAASLPRFPGCDANKVYNFVSVPAENEKLISYYELTFNKGVVTSARIAFKRGIDRERFKIASLAAFEAKWGAVGNDSSADIITKVNSKFKVAQRSFMVDHWEIKHDIPEFE